MECKLAYVLLIVTPLLPPLALWRLLVEVPDCMNAMSQLGLASKTQLRCLYKNL
jgi:hypothetical protein